MVYLKNSANAPMAVMISMNLRNACSLIFSTILIPTANPTATKMNNCALCHILTVSIVFQLQI